MGRSTQLRAVLKARFFKHVEGLGFIRDERHQPSFTCFRRKTDSVVQIFDVQWEKYGRSRFVLNFAEAPLAGIEYLGAHVPADELTPGAIILPRGRLMPGHGIFTGGWFRLDRPLLHRLISRQRDYDVDYVVDQVLELFPEIVAWWENKTQGAHLRLSPPEPLDRQPNKPLQPTRASARG